MERIETEKFLPITIDKFIQVHSKKMIISILFIIFFVIIYLARQDIRVNLSIKYMNSSTGSSLSYNKQFEVVLSYYKEDVHFVARFIQYLRNVSTLQKLKPYIIIYNKNSMINNTYLKTVLQADIVHQLPNLGREGATYLYHMIENYDKLVNHILFCQAGVEGIHNGGLDDWLLSRLDKQLNSSVGYMPLVEMKWMVTFDCGRWAAENMERLPQMWGIIEQTLCPPGGQAVAFRGQFLISGKRIRNRPLRIYKYIYELITADKTHWIHYTSDSTPDNPIFGHVVERLWTTLFNCTKPDLIDRCRRNECACYD